MTNGDEIERIRKVYSEPVRKGFVHQEFPWHPRNPIFIYYRQAQERGLISLFNQCGFPLKNMRVLDIGCGYGGFLRFLGSLGVPPENLHGIDLMPERIEEARKISPLGINYQIGNAEQLPYPDQSFELVCQFTVFSSVLDHQSRRRIAREMVRVLKQGGHTLWYDMRRSKGSVTRGIERGEIHSLFQTCSLKFLHPLHPPFASRFAKRSIFLCELWDHLSVFKKTHYLALLLKKE